MSHSCALCGKPATGQCGKCKEYYYCERSCQVKHWPSHKPECLLIEGKRKAGEQLAKGTTKKSKTVFVDLVTPPPSDDPDSHGTLSDDDDSSQMDQKRLGSVPMEESSEEGRLESGLMDQGPMEAGPMEESDDDAHSNLPRPVRQYQADPDNPFPPLTKDQKNSPWGAWIEVDRALKITRQLVVEHLELHARYGSSAKLRASGRMAELGMVGNAESAANLAYSRMQVALMNHQIQRAVINVWDLFTAFHIPYQQLTFHDPDPAARKSVMDKWDTAAAFVRMALADRTPNSPASLPDTNMDRAALVVFNLELATLRFSSATHKVDHATSQEKVEELDNAREQERQSYQASFDRAWEVIAPSTAETETLKNVWRNAYSASPGWYTHIMEVFEALRKMRSVAPEKAPVGGDDSASSDDDGFPEGWQPDPRSPIPQDVPSYDDEQEWVIPEPSQRRYLQATEAIATFKRLTDEYLEALETGEDTLPQKEQAEFAWDKMWDVVTGGDIHWRMKLVVKDRFETLFADIEQQGPRSMADTEFSLVYEEVIYNMKSLAEFMRPMPGVANSPEEALENLRHANKKYAWMVRWENVSPAVRQEYVNAYETAWAFIYQDPTEEDLRDKAYFDNVYSTEELEGPDPYGGAKHVYNLLDELVSRFEKHLWRRRNAPLPSVADQGDDSAEEFERQARALEKRDRRAQRKKRSKKKKKKEKRPRSEDKRDKEISPPDVVQKKQRKRRTGRDNPAFQANARDRLKKFGRQFASYMIDRHERHEAGEEAHWLTHANLFKAYINLRRYVYGGAGTIVEKKDEGMRRLRDVVAAHDADLLYGFKTFDNVLAVFNGLYEYFLNSLEGDGKAPLSLVARFHRGHRWINREIIGFNNGRHIKEPPRGPYRVEPQKRSMSSAQVVQELRVYRETARDFETSLREFTRNNARISEEQAQTIQQKGDAVLRLVPVEGDMPYLLKRAKREFSAFLMMYQQDPNALDVSTDLGLARHYFTREMDAYYGMATPDVKVEGRVSPLDAMMANFELQTYRRVWYKLYQKDQAERVLGALGDLYTVVWDDAEKRAGNKLTEQMKNDRRAMFSGGYLHGFYGEAVRAQIAMFQDVLGLRDKDNERGSPEVQTGGMGNGPLASDPMEESDEEIVVTRSPPPVRPTVVGRRAFPFPLGKGSAEVTFRISDTVSFAMYPITDNNEADKLAMREWFELQRDLLQSRKDDLLEFGFTEDALDALERDIYPSCIAELLPAESRSHDKPEPSWVTRLFSTKQPDLTFMTMLATFHEKTKVVQDERIGRSVETALRLFDEEGLVRKTASSKYPGDLFFVMHAAVLHAVKKLKGDSSVAFLYVEPLYYAETLIEPYALDIPREGWDRENLIENYSDRFGMDKPTVEEVFWMSEVGFVVLADDLPLSEFMDETAGEADNRPPESNARSIVLFTPFNKPIVIGADPTTAQRIDAFNARFTPIEKNGDVTIYKDNARDLRLAVKLIEDDQAWPLDEVKVWSTVSQRKLKGFVKTVGYIMWNRAVDGNTHTPEGNSLFSVSIAFEYISATFKRHPEIKLTPMDRYSLFAELLAILGAARQKTLFRHNDIHEGNIGIRIANFGRNYYFHGHVYRFKRKFAPVLFDLGKSTFNKDVQASSDIYNTMLMGINFLKGKNDNAGFLSEYMALYGSRGADPPTNVRGINQILRERMFRRVVKMKKSKCKDCNENAVVKCRICPDLILCKLHGETHREEVH